MKPAKYTILSELREHLLISLVQAHMNDGWLPLGGVAVAEYGSSMKYMQAMIRYETV